MTGAPSPRRIPDLLVEKVFLGEATEEERARVMADADARERLRELPMHNARFLVTHPPEEVVPRIEDRVRIAEARDRLTKRSGALGGMLLVPLFAAALALAVVAVPKVDHHTGPEPTTAKGLDARLHVYQETPTGPRRLNAGQVLRKGDLVQLAIVPGEARDAVVLSIDGRGGVTRHFPEGDGSTELAGHGEIRLPDAMELDDAPRFERFVLVSGQAPIDVGAVEAAIRAVASRPDAQTASATLPAGLSQAWFLVRKEER